MAIHSLAGALEPGDDLLTRPPFSAPHHDASKASLIGGGTGRVRPGEISRAHCGVLFLDEFPLFRTDVIEALRQPLESGEITIARGDDSATFPARGMVVLACNPCPCGDYSDDQVTNRCSCLEVKRRNYRSRITGPIADRIDIVRHVMPIKPAGPRRSRGSARSRPPRSGRGSSRRALRQDARYDGRSWRLNAQTPGPAAARRVAADRRGRSGGSTTSCTPVGSAGEAPPACSGWRGRSPTSPDVDRPGLAEVDIALRLRSGDPAADRHRWRGAPDERLRAAGPGRPVHASPSQATRG